MAVVLAPAPIAFLDSSSAGEKQRQGRPTFNVSGPGTVFFGSPRRRARSSGRTLSAAAWFLLHSPYHLVLPSIFPIRA